MNVEPRTSESALRADEVNYPMRIEDRKSREAALRDVVELRQPIEESVAVLQSFDWDSEIELVVMTRTDASANLERFLNREIRASDLELWANALESREDLGRETAFADLLDEFLFSLANPTLSEPITPAAARRWLQRLSDVVETDR